MKKFNVTCAAAIVALGACAISNYAPLRALAQDDTQARPGGSSSGGGQEVNGAGTPVQDDTAARHGGSSVEGGQGVNGSGNPVQDDTAARHGGSSVEPTQQGNNTNQVQPPRAGRNAQAPRNAVPRLQQRGQPATQGMQQQPRRQYTANRPTSGPGRAFLGIDFDSRANGAVVARVHPDTPAAQVGLMAGDMIFGLNDQPINSAQELTYWISQMQPDQQVTIHFNRPTSVQVALGQRGQYDALRNRTGLEQGTKPAPSDRLLDEQTGARDRDGKAQANDKHPGAKDQAKDTAAKQPSDASAHDKHADNKQEKEEQDNDQPNPSTDDQK